MKKKVCRLALLVIFIVATFACVSCNNEESLKEFSGIVFSDQTIVYDGQYHSVEVDGIPPFATVSYSKSNMKEVGTYTIVATIEADGYKTHIRTAKLTIKKADFKNLVFNNKEIKYDGNKHNLQVYGVPNFATVTYSEQNIVEPGFYKITATVSAPNYNTWIKTAYLTITNGTTGFTFSKENEYYVVTGYTGTDAEVVIPETYLGLPVKRIAANAFANNVKITSVYIPTTVTKIGLGAFANCVKLEKISVPFVGAEKTGNLKSHFSYIFGDNYQQNKTSVPDSLKWVEILEGCENIGSFRNCSNIERISVPSTIVKMEQSFTGCVSLSRIDIVDLKNWCEIDFGMLISNGGILQNNGSLYISEQLVEHLVISSDIKEIPMGAFAGCNNIKTIVIEKGVENIGAHAFMDMVVEKIELPFVNGYFSQLGLSATTVVFSGNKIEDFSFSNDYSFKNIILNEGVVEIGNLAFSRASQLESIVIAKTVKKIGYSALKKCDKLNKIFYKGTAEDWKNIIIDYDNQNLDEIPIYFFSENCPTEKGNYWHYVNNQPVIYEESLA